MKSRGATCQASHEALPKFPGIAPEFRSQNCSPEVDFALQDTRSFSKATVAKQLHWQRPVDPSLAVQSPAAAAGTLASGLPAVGSSASGQHP